MLARTRNLKLQLNSVQSEVINNRKQTAQEFKSSNLPNTARRKPHSAANPTASLTCALEMKQRKPSKHHWCQTKQNIWNGISEKVTCCLRKNLFFSLATFWVNPETSCQYFSFFNYSFFSLRETWRGKCLSFNIHVISDSISDFRAVRVDFQWNCWNIFKLNFLFVFNFLNFNQSCDCWTAGLRVEI